MVEKNRLILGDNLEVLKQIPDETIDLIYLDPPFFSNRTYEVIWGDEGEIRSFDDRFSGGIEHYIAWLKERVIEMHRILKKTGSIFLHCDWHANAYIRVNILDRIFGYSNFRNEILWCYKRPSAPNQKQLSRLHDSIYWYSKSNKWKFNGDNIRIEYSESSILRAGYKGNVSKMTKGGKVELKENGKLPEDWWDIPMLKGNSKEWIGYPTQKPEKLLERIIKMGSDEGDLILDPFVGGGTTIVVAEKLKRKWIGIDQSPTAIRVSENRLYSIENLFTSNFEVEIHKYDYETLRYKDSFEFEKWIIEKFGGIGNEKQRGDFGIDGRTKDNIPIQVKRSENIGRNVIDNFYSAIKRYDKQLYEKRKENNKTVGYIIGFSFSRGAIEEVARLKNEENVIIELVKVESIVPISIKPDFEVKIENYLKSNDKVKVTFQALKKNSDIKFYSWDFNYRNNFNPEILYDKEGKQTQEFKKGNYKIAIKGVNHEGIDNLKIYNLEINDKIELKLL